MSASPWMTDRPLATQSLTPFCDSSRPRASTPRVVGQQAQQRAVAAADIEHAAVRLDHVGDQQEVGADVPARGAAARAGSACP